MGVPKIELRGVCKSYGLECVVNEVTLQVDAGESIVFVGPSGSGKSTLLKMLAGIVEPDRGDVFFEGQPRSKMTQDERIGVARQMGMLFQKNALFDSLTCDENIRFPLRETTELNDQEIEARVAHFLKAVGLAQAVGQYPDEISGGMQKRLGIARALALHPEIIFYDDPTAGLDPITSRMIVNLILSLKREHDATILTVTNDMKRAYQLAGRIFLVVDQTLIEAGNAAQTQAHSDPRVQQFIHGHLTGPLTELS